VCVCVCVCVHACLHSCGSRDVFHLPRRDRDCGGRRGLIFIFFLTRAAGLAMLGKLGVSGSFGVAYVYGMELFPTCVRNIGDNKSERETARGGGTPSNTPSNPQSNTLATPTATARAEGFGSLM